MSDKFLDLRVRPWGLLSSVTVIVCIGTVLGFLGRLFWPFELTAHFRVQYFLFLILSAIIYLVGKKFKEGILAGLFALINLYLIVPFYLGALPHNINSHTFRALLININFFLEPPELYSSIFRALTLARNWYLLSISWISQSRPSRASCDSLIVG